jgi:hypothetical protein
MLYKEASEQCTKTKITITHNFIQYSRKKRGKNDIISNEKKINEAIITQTDKGNTAIILQEKEYDN